MSAPSDNDPKTGPRRARAFRMDDPSIVRDAEDPIDSDNAFAPEDDPAAPLEPQARRLTVGEIKRGFRWGSVFLSAAFLLASLSLGLWFTNFVSVALARTDWVGNLAVALAIIMAVAAIAIVIREFVGLMHLASLERLRKQADQARISADTTKEKKTVRALLSHYATRKDMKWYRARLAEHLGDVHEPGALMQLANRELFKPLDHEARRLILKSAKRNATATAISPIMFIAMAFVLVENMRMFRALATLYGGRPGFLGGLRLAKLVIGHIVATGGIALTDDLLGQFLGQDMLRRLSRRLGEGAFNGALTARLGVAAIEVLRPLPPPEGEKVRVREIFSELFRALRGAPGEQRRTR